MTATKSGNAAAPEHDPYSPILHCLRLRAQYLGNPQGWQWVLGDPVVGTFAPALYVIDQAGFINLPALLRERVRSIYLHVAAAGINRLTQLKPLLTQLDQAGIAVIPLKGAALLETHYKQVGLRPMSDIDILVSPEDFLSAAEILIAAGLKPAWKCKGGDTFSFRNLPKSFWPLSLDLQGGQGLCLDVHQHLIAFHWFRIAYPVNIESLWARCITDSSQAESPGTDLSNLWKTRLSPYDMLAHLCLHPSFHGLRDMKSFFDIDTFIRCLPDHWDWSRFIAIAEAWGIRNCAFHAFKFSMFFFDTPVPTVVLRELDPGGFLRFQVRTLTSAAAVLQDRRTLGRRFQPLVLFSLFDGVSKQLRTLINALFPKKIWLRNHPEYHSLWGHWLFIIRRLFRNTK